MGGRGRWGGGVRREFRGGGLCWDTVVARLAGYGQRWMGPKTLEALNVTAGLVFFGFALRLLWKLSQTFR